MTSVSIVINNHNYAGFVGEALDSALAQTYPRVEVIAVDDGSTDHSREVIAEYRRAVTAVFKPNGGQASAFNAGFERTRGDLIVFLDADDALLPTAAESAVASLDGEDVAKVHWPLIEVDAAGVPMGSLRPPPGRLPDGDIRESTLRDGPHAHEFPPTSGNAWARRFCESVFPIPALHPSAWADAYLLAVAPLAGRVRRVSTPQGLYRLHGDNHEASRTAYRMNQVLLEVYERQCVAMSEYLLREGLEVDPARWQSGNDRYDWRRKFRDAGCALLQLVPPGSTFVLIDDDQWDHYWGSSEVLDRRYATPLLAPDGQFGPLPPDDTAAIEAVRAHRAAGRELLVISWVAFWWLDHYPGLAVHLRSEYSCVLDDERLLAFDLTSKPSAGARRS